MPTEISIESASDPKRTATVRAQIQLRLGTQYVRGACGYTRPVGEPSPCCCTTPPTPCVSQATRMRATRHKPGGRGGDAVVPSRLEVAFCRLVGLARRRRPPPLRRCLRRAFPITLGRGAPGRHGKPASMFDARVARSRRATSKVDAILMAVKGNRNITTV